MRKSLVICFLVSLCGLISAQGLPIVEQTLQNPENEPAPCHPVPSERQLKWHDIEFYAFFHYGMNTYTNREWGYGNENVDLFNPSAMPNPAQWLESVKAAGMKGGIAVVKHHDGFCLWPTKTTSHNCANSKNEFARKTNIPRDFAAAAKDLGMSYGFYISPWDRNSELYATDRYVKEVFMEQCMELSEYGDDQFEMWFDGANGGDGFYGGANETRKVDQSIYYDVPNLRDFVHATLPNCVMWGVGGEARWIGNEAGYAGETNWCMLDRGQTNPGNNTIGKEDGWLWVPGESDAKATSAGWFWHPKQKELSSERLFQMYLETVGRNANLILNVPPDPSGLLPVSTVDTLKMLGILLDTRLGNDLAKNARVEASSERTPGKTINYSASNLTDGDKDTYWATDDDIKNATITLSWDVAQTLRYVELMEHIEKGQRVKKFNVEISEDGFSWHPVASDVTTTTIGHKRIIPLNGKTSESYDGGHKAKALRINITESRACPLISKLSVY